MNGNMRPCKNIATIDVGRAHTKFGISCQAVVSNMRAPTVVLIRPAVGVGEHRALRPGYHAHLQAIALCSLETIRGHRQCRDHQPVVRACWRIQRHLKHLVKHE